MSNQITIKEKSINSILLTNVIAALSVLFLHTNGCFWDFSSTESYWFSANIIESTFYFAVPCFFMITGATMLDYCERYSTCEYFLRRVKKTVIPYIAWSLLYVLYMVITNQTDVKDVTVLYLIKGLADFNLVGLFWFFRPLFCAYLCIPLLSAVQKEKKIRVFSIMMLLALMINNVIPFIISVLKIDFPISLSVAVCSGYLFFVLCGYVLTNLHIRLPIRLCIYFVSIVGLLLHMVGTYVSSVAKGEIVKTFKEYTNLPTVLYSMGVFLLIKQLSGVLKNSNFWRIIKWLAKYTFPSYLMQMFFLNFISKYTSIDRYSLTYRLGSPIIIFVCIILVTIVLRKIPVFKRIVP